MKEIYSIEFIGVPGSGKTTICKSFYSKKNDYFGSLYPDFIINTSEKRSFIKIFQKSLFAFIYLIRKPKKSQKLLYKIFESKQETKSEVLSLSLNILYISFFLYYSRHMKKKVILDQGIFQAIWSINLKSRNIIPLKEFLKIIELPDIIIYVKVDDNLTHSRLEQRKGKNSRMEKISIDEYILLNKKGLTVIDQMVHELKNNNIKVVEVTNNKIEDLDSSINLLLKTILPSMHYKT